MEDRSPGSEPLSVAWTREQAPRRWDYAAFRAIDGSHPLRERAPGACVVYQARRVRGARVLYFNFDLAREMGLIDADHPDTLSARLERAILDAFAIQIINEYDIIHRTPIAAEDKVPHDVFATRYLQLQHPSRRGTTSGDGRSVWNGAFQGRDALWDVTSCGTGATKLCPATAQTKRYYKTGSRTASYGCGTAAPAEGIAAGLMSEIFHRNGLATERVLAVLRRADGFAITVRAGRNLLRPSHFFAPLKQGDLERLRALVDVFTERQLANRVWPRDRTPAQRYARFAESIARSFAQAAATFEREYIFCWLDWDGDNILADGGIIDYGSVRQFGLFHREYRYDDGPRFSTTITEQKRKARAIVQGAAQIRDFLITGRKPPLASLRRDPLLALFDREFEATRDRLLLRQIGFDRRTQDALLRHDRRLVRRFDRAFSSFERARSARGRRKCTDGITWDAVYCMRDVLRELPRCLRERFTPLAPRDLLAIALSSYASAKDRRRSASRARAALELQGLYMVLISRAARRLGSTRDRVLATVDKRSATINRLARVTGDSVTLAAERLLRHRRKLSAAEFQDAMKLFIAENTLDPEHPDARSDHRGAAPWQQRIADELSDLVTSLRHGL